MDNSTTTTNHNSIINKNPIKNIRIYYIWYLIQDVLGQSKDNKEQRTKGIA